METKTIAIDLEAYEVLRRHKREGESFSDAVKRLAGAHRPLADLAGLWKDWSPGDLRRFERFRLEGRQLEAKRLERLAKRRA